MSKILQRIEIPLVFTLLTDVIFVCSLLTFVIPSGHFAREMRSVGGHDRTVVVPDTYSTLPKHFSGKGLLFRDEEAGHASPVSLERFLSAIPRGITVVLEDGQVLDTLIFSAAAVLQHVHRSKEPPTYS